MTERAYQKAVNIQHLKETIEEAKSKLLKLEVSE